MLKEQMLSELVHSCGGNYHSVSFYVTPPTSKSELTERVESYKTTQGRYLYRGEFVSREYLEEILANEVYKVEMEAYVQI